ncbi:hypothetical protein H0H81_012556, partial [Sphagnurus paluster]
LYSSSQESGLAKGGQSYAVIFILLILIAGAPFLGVFIDRTLESQERLQARQRWEIEMRNHQKEEIHWRSRLDDLYLQEIELVQKLDQMNQDYILQEAQWKIRMNRAETTFNERVNDLNERYQQRERELQKRMDQAETTFNERVTELNGRYQQRERQLQKRIEHFEEELRKKFEWEKRERERAQVYWKDVQGEVHCLANGRKKYTAQLANLPPTVDGMVACKETSIEINGITYNSPISCENRGNGVIRGHWIADNETLCAAYWEFVKLKDCTAPKSGLRRIEAKLGAVHAGEDAERLCLTTPLTINGQTYEQPMACPDWRRYGFWGIWNIPDDNCR